jgi:hypothetical protein
MNVGSALLSVIPIDASRKKKSTSSCRSSRILSILITPSCGLIAEPDIYCLCHVGKFNLRFLATKDPQLTTPVG